MTNARPTWAFLTNHGAALLVIAARPAATLRELADTIGVTERAATRIVKDLRDAGYVTATRVGRRNSYTLDASAPMIHPVVAGYTVGSLIRALSAEPEAGAPAPRD